MKAGRADRETLSRDRLVAHRGQNADYPENTLEALQAAIRCGALFLETDIQLSADGVPVLCHDPSLLRTAGINADVRELSMQELSTLMVGEPARFGDKFSRCGIPDLKHALVLLRRYPEVQLFIELKQESIDRFGIEFFVDRTLEYIAESGTQNQCIVISFNRESLLYLKQVSSLRSGWVIRNMGGETLALARQLAPDYAFINHLRCENTAYDFSADPWDWAVYETDDPALVQTLLARGIALVESNNICKLLNPA